MAVAILIFVAPEVTRWGWGAPKNTTCILKHTLLHGPSSSKWDHHLLNEHHTVLTKTWNHRLIPQTHQETVYWGDKSSEKSGRFFFINSHKIGLLFETSWGSALASLFKPGNFIQYNICCGQDWNILTIKWQILWPLKIKQKESLCLVCLFWATVETYREPKKP